MKGMVFLNSVVLLLQVNFVSGFRLELMYISLMENIRLSLTHVHGFQLLVQLPYFIEMDFFVFTKRIVIVAKGFLKMPNLHMLIKQKSPLLPSNLALKNFAELVIVFSTNVNPLFNGPEVSCSAFDKAKLFTENFSKNSNLDDSGISLPVFYPRTNLKLNNISVTPKMVKKVIINLDSSKASRLDCVPVVVLKKCEPKLSYILAELFNKCLKESRFLDCWKVSSVVPVFKNVGVSSTAKKYGLLSVVSKVL